MMSTFYCKIMLLDDAMIVRPVTAEDIKWANNELENSNLPSIPTGYADFLKHCNGFAFNGVELYGTDIVTDPETNFQLIDITLTSAISYLPERGSRTRDDSIHHISYNILIKKFLLLISNLQLL